MSHTVLVLHPEQPPVNRRAVLRYMGCRAPSDEINARLDECLKIAAEAFDFRLCYTTLPLEVTAAASGASVRLGTAVLPGRSLARHLDGCNTAVLMAATVGLSIDRLIARYGRLAPATGLCLQALGTERIEALCDDFCDGLAAELSAEGLTLTSRFSPGYGDLPLSIQPVIFDLLDCPRRIGLTLTDGGLMSPSKSVTAVVGIRRKDETP